MKNKNASLLITLSVVTLLATTPFINAQEKTKNAKPKKSFIKKVTGVFKPFGKIFGKSKSKESEDLENAARDKSGPLEKVDPRTVINALQTAAVEGPEIYSLLINDSIDRLLERAENHACSIKWGSNERFIQQLVSKSILEKNKASLLLQMKIWESYLDDPMPFKTFIQDLTRERLLLEEYESAILKLSTNEWFKNNETIDNRTKKILSLIKQRKQNLDQLNSLILQLLDKPHELTEPNIFKLIQNNIPNGSPVAVQPEFDQADDEDLLKKKDKKS